MSAEERQPLSLKSLGMRRTAFAAALGMVILLAWPPPVSNATWLLGVRTGNDLGLPAIVWEHPLTPLMMLTLAVGENRGFTGVHLQVGTKWYTRPHFRGFYAQMAATSGHGRTPHAAWSSLQVSASVGHSWALFHRLGTMVEVGTAVRVVGAHDIAGRKTFSRTTLPLALVSLTWRF